MRTAEFFDGTVVDIPDGNSGYVLIALGLEDGQRVFDVGEYSALGICEAHIVKQPDLAVRGQTVQLYGRDGAEVIADGRNSSRMINLNWKWASEEANSLLSGLDDVAAFMDTDAGPHWLYDLRGDMMARVQPHVMRPDSTEGTASNEARVNLSLEMLTSRYVSAAIYSETYPETSDPGESIFAGEVVESTLTVNNSGRHEVAPVITLLARGLPNSVIIRNTTKGQYMQIQDNGFSVGAEIVIDMREGTATLITVEGASIDSPAAIVDGGLIKLDPGENIITVTPSEGAALPSIYWKTEQAYSHAD